MAPTSMLTTNALAIELWSKMGFIDLYKRSWFGHAASRGSIFISDELANAQIGTGDKLTYNFTAILSGLGTGEGGTLVGNTEALDNQSDTMVINTVRHGVESPNRFTIEQQRTNIDFENRARTLLPNWHRSRLDASFFNQLAGVNSTTITVDGAVYSGSKRSFIQGNNAITAPSVNRILRAGNQANDESLTTVDTFTLDLVDAALERTMTTQPTIETFDDDSYDLYISHEQSVDLKRDTTGKVQWYTNELAQVQGGDTGDNKIIQGSMLGKRPIAKYANVNIYECSRVATGVNSGTNAAIPNVSRAVLVGKNAAAFGSPIGGRLTDTNVPMKFFIELQDFEYLKAVEARMIYGLKKIVFDNEDYGSVVISTFAATHNS